MQNRLKRLKEAPQMDFVFIDGPHTYANVRNDSQLQWDGVVNSWGPVQGCKSTVEEWVLDVYVSRYRDMSSFSLKLFIMPKTKPFSAVEKIKLMKPPANETLVPGLADLGTSRPQGWHHSWT